MANPGKYPFHGGQLRQIAERFGVPVGELLDFSANINPNGPPPSVVAAIRAGLDDLTTLTEYPDLQQTDLKRSLGRYTLTSEEHVVVANGFVPLLEAALHSLKIRTCLLPVPAFVEYRKTLERVGVGVVPYALSAADLFRYDPAAMLTTQCDAVLFANPQNPTGVCADRELLRDLVAKASAKGMYVLLDEAFTDYVPQHSLTTMVDDFPKLVVFRSVTKFYGIPGLRVAYATANPALTRVVTDNLAPWPITTLASQAVITALGDQTYANLSRSENLIRRAALQEDLISAGLTLYPSAASFVFFRLPPAIDHEAFWKHMIVKDRIVLRSCGDYEALAKGYFRAAVRTHCENEKLTLALVKALSELQSGTE